MFKIFKKIIKYFVLYIVVINLTALSVDAKNNDKTKSRINYRGLYLDDTDDLSETMNRFLYKNSESLMNTVLYPVADVYTKNTANSVQTGILNFFQNLHEPLNTFHNFLQADFTGGAVSASRFAINSTIGLFGLIDWGNDFGLKLDYEDAGQTLATWGVPAGNVIYIPFIGPATIRRITGIVVDIYISPTRYAFKKWFPNKSQRFWIYTGLFTLDTFSTYAKYYKQIDVILKSSLDPYATYKNFYFERRRKLILEEDYELMLNDKADKYEDSDLSFDEEEQEVSLDDFDI